VSIFADEGVRVDCFFGKMHWRNKNQTAAWLAGAIKNTVHLALWPGKKC
jgi:hypothetical protein